MASPRALVVILCVLLLGLTQNVLSKRTSELKREILDQIIPKNANDVLISPGNSTNGPTIVEVFMHVLNIDKLNEEKMDFTVRVLLRQLWKDDRLVYDSKGQIKNIVLNDPDVIWTPDTFFSNEIKGHSFDITHPNVFIRIYPEGTVLYSKKLSITVSCAMDLRKFPFDKQWCYLRMGTYGSTTDDVILLWREYVPVSISRSLHLPVFSLEKFLTYSGIVNMNTGEYSYLTLSFYLSRSINYYILQTFIPCTMLVILSWIPFWLNNKHLTSRILLSLAPLLTCAVIVYDQSKNRAKVSYSTCLDCFTGTCLVLMFASIVESIIVHKLSENDQSKDCSVANGDVHKEENRIISTAKAWIAKIPCKTHYIDVGARVVMPTIYLIFCLIYFTSIGGLSEEDPIVIHGNQTKETLVNRSIIQK